MIVEDYFAVTGASLQGRSISGEWMAYDTSSVAGTSIFQSIGIPGLNATEATVEQRISTASLEGAGVLSNSTWMWGGGLLGAAALAGGGGGGGATAADTSALGVIKSYAASGGGVRRRHRSSTPRWGRRCPVSVV